MPLIKRRIEPVDISRTVVPSHISSELEFVCNSSLAHIMRQLASLSAHAEDLFSELHRDAASLLYRVGQLTERLDRVKGRIVKLNPIVEEVLLQDINMRKPFKSSIIKEQQIITQATRPQSVKFIYQQRCEPPPNLQLLDQFREDGRDSLKFYTDPGYFLELWCMEMAKDAENQMKRHKHRGRRNARPSKETRSIRVPKTHGNYSDLRHGPEFVENLRHEQQSYYYAGGSLTRQSTLPSDQRCPIVDARSAAVKSDLCRSASLQVTSQTAAHITHQTALHNDLQSPPANVPQTGSRLPPPAATGYNSSSPPPRYTPSQPATSNTVCTKSTNSANSTPAAVVYSQELGHIVSRSASLRQPAIQQQPLPQLPSTVAMRPMLPPPAPPGDMRNVVTVNSQVTQSQSHTDNSTKHMNLVLVAAVTNNSSSTGVKSTGVNSTTSTGADRLPSPPRVVTPPNDLDPLPSPSFLPPPPLVFGESDWTAADSAAAAADDDEMNADDATLVRDTRCDLLSAIREGIQLRKVEERRQKSEQKQHHPSTSGRLDVQAIMEAAFEMRRKALEDNDSDDDDNDGNWSDN